MSIVDIFYSLIYFTYYITT